MTIYTKKKDLLFSIVDWNTKVGSREISGVTGRSGLGVQNGTGQRLTEFCQENILVIADTLFQQHKRQLYTWTSPDGHYQNQIDYIDYFLCSLRQRSSIQSAEIRPGADYGSDHKLLIKKFRLKLKKVGEPTRPFRYDKHQIPYNYTLEVTNRLKGLGLVDGVPEEIWTEVHKAVREVVTKTIPKKEKCKKSKWLSEEDLQIAEKRREMKGKGERQRYTQLNAEFQRIARRDKKAFLSEQCKGIPVTPTQINHRLGSEAHRGRECRVCGC